MNLFSFLLLFPALAIGLLTQSPTLTTTAGAQDAVRLSDVAVLETAVMLYSMQNPSEPNAFPAPQRPGELNAMNSATPNGLVGTYVQQPFPYPSPGEIYCYGYSEDHGSYWIGTSLERDGGELHVLGGAPPFTALPTQGSFRVQGTGDPCASISAPGWTFLSVQEIPETPNAPSLPPVSPIPYSQGTQVLIDVRNDCLLGGSQGSGTWLTADALASNLRATDTYTLVTLAGEVGAVSGLTPKRGEDVCTETYFMDLPQEDRQRGGIGVTRAPTPLRPVTVVTSWPKVYEEDVVTALKAEGVKAPRARIRTVLRADLEGDGTEEVLIAASSYVDGPFAEAAAGDYSLVLLRRSVGERVLSSLVRDDIYREATSSAAPVVFTLGPILDYDGDGIMEVAIHGEYYEGSWTDIVSIRDGVSEDVLSCGCGV